MKAGVECEKATTRSMRIARSRRQQRRKKYK
jgi:hypothetical protein